MIYLIDYIRLNNLFFMSILVSGSLVFDNIMNFPDTFKRHILPDQIHVLNVAFMVDRVEKSWGGTGGNIAYTLGLLGADPILVSAVGKDGDDYLKYLNKVGVSTEYVLQDPTKLTAAAYITTDEDDNQITAFYNGPLSLAGKVELAAVPMRPDLAIISPTAKEVMIKHMLDCKERGIKTVFDPGQQITAFSEAELKSMIDCAEFVIGNDYEMKLLEERTGWNGSEILKHTKYLITTLGERGSAVYTADGEQVEAGVCPPLSFDDPTGAGDAYRAGFFAGFAKGMPLLVCAQMGAVAASYAIETYGTQAHTFTKAEFAVRYEKAFGSKIVI